MVTDILLFGYFELAYKLNVTWLSEESGAFRKKRLEQIKHFLRREYPGAGTISGWSVLIGALTTAVFTGGLMIDSRDWDRTALGIFIGLVVGIAHLTISNFLWKVKMLRQIQFKGEIIPLDEKYTYKIKELSSQHHWGQPPFKLFFENDLGLQHLILSNEEKENLKALCFEYIEELRNVLNSDVKKYSELKDSTKELFEVEWSIYAHFKYGAPHVHQIFGWHKKWDGGAHLFYSIDQPHLRFSPELIKVKFVVLSLPECYLLNLA